jgi:hypothetical protein
LLQTPPIVAGVVSCSRTGERWKDACAISFIGNILESMDVGNCMGWTRAGQFIFKITKMSFKAGSKLFASWFEDQSH